MVVAGAVVVVVWVSIAATGEPVRDLAYQLASGEFRGFAVGEDAEPLTEWDGVALDIPIMFFPGGDVSSFQSGGPGAVGEERRVQSVETTLAAPDDVFAWYLGRCAPYGFAEADPSGDRRTLSIPDTAARTGMVMIEVSPGLVRARRGGEMIHGTRIVLSVHPPAGEAEAER